MGGVGFGYPKFGVGDGLEHVKGDNDMKISRFTAYRRAAGVGAGCVLGGMAIVTVGAPSATAAPDCSPDGVQATVSTATGSARQYIDSHPGANQAVAAAYSQPRQQAAANLRNYFTTHPQEYNDLRGILAPIGDTERQCNVTALPPNLESAYRQFMGG